MSRLQRIRAGEPSTSSVSADQVHTIIPPLSSDPTRTRIILLGGLQKPVMAPITPDTSLVPRASGSSLQVSLPAKQDTRTQDKEEVNELEMKNVNLL